MRSQLPFRFCLGAMLVLAAAPAFARAQQPRFAAPPPPSTRPQIRGIRPAGPVMLAQNGGGRMAQNRPGLEMWMQQHQNLSPAQQERELQNEPGFRQLPPQLQQRELNQLRRLQSMNPQQRARSFALLQMTPEQRQQFTASVQQFMALPPDRKALVRRAFAALRRVPPRDRPAAMNAFPPVQQLSPYERQTLANLLTWEPYMDNAGSPN